MTALPPSRDFRVRLVELLRAASIEIAAKPTVAAPLRGAFDPGTEVFINQPPTGDYHAAVATAVALRRAGFQPVAHIAARNIASLAELDDYLGRLVGAAGAERVLLIAGDRPQPRGPFASAADVLTSGRIEASGIRAVGFAGHPEGHPQAAAGAMEQALVTKCDRAAQAGLSSFIVTQFCFDAAPILAYVNRLEALGIAAPVKVGVAARASVATLVRFAAQCGVGASLRKLRTQSKTVGRLIGEAGPEDLLRDLAVGLTDIASDRVVGIHLYAFGGVASAASWLDATLSRLYDSIARTAAEGPAESPKRERDTASSDPP